MVNENRHIKETILERLCHAQGNPISGVRLSQDLGVSRVSIWKHMAELKKKGADIISSPKGYRLLNPDDPLLPSLFKPVYQDRIFHFKQVTSTMDKARQLAKKGVPHLSVVVAEQQTAGRGRLNRKWQSQNGGLWFTLILKPQTPPPLSYVYNFIASSCLSHLINQLFDLPVKVKWPNDLLHNGNKLAGLLSEMETRADMVEFISIGIGLNVNNHPAKDEPNAVSLSDILGHPVSRRQILESFLDDFSDRVLTINPVSAIETWKRQTSTIGSQVRIETPARVYSGKAVDVDHTGALIIKDNHGQSQKIIYGDCFHT
jgi:BirA family biotin operon repressor/biotin-[acetyl-CoA-carboxylase] ligase